MDKQLNILIIGYGRMGKSIEALSKQKGHHIIGIIDQNQDWLSLDQIMQKADVAIEFTTPDAAPDNIRRCFAHNLPVVCGTTGWYNSLKSITEECLSLKQTFFYAPNFSIGVNVFFEINKKLASILSNMSAYKPRITETHHTGKLDAPSGTAIQLANDIIPHLRNLKGWTLEGQEATNNLLPIKAVRKDQVTGTHEVMYDSGIDAITLIHKAHNRNGFVEGALLAAEWVHDKQGVFTMKDLMNI
jgi:4-hydroxy-tetrahydrodipicolinate reductase